MTSDDHCFSILASDEYLLYRDILDGILRRVGRRIYNIDAAHIKCTPYDRNVGRSIKC
jgi:hypothetical protein